MVYQEVREIEPPLCQNVIENVNKTVGIITVKH